MVIDNNTQNCSITILQYSKKFKIENLYYKTFHNDIYLGYTEQCHGNLSKRMPDLLGCHINL